MNRYRKLFLDTVVLGLGTFGSKLLVFLLMPLYTALLSTTEYSTAELISGTANLLIPLACVGITNGIFRFAAERESDKEKVFSNSVVLLTVGMVCSAVFVPILETVTYFDGYVWLIMAYVVSADIQAVCAQYVRATDRTRLYAVQGILNTMLTIGCNLLFLLAFDMGVTGYVLSVIVGNLLTSVYLILRAKLWRALRFHLVDRKTMGELLRFSLPMIPATVCWLITDLSDRYLVTYFCGGSVNGIYSAAYKIPGVVNLMTGIFMQAWQFSAVVQASDEESCKKFYGEVFGGFLSLVFIGTSVLILMSDLLTGLLLNEAYADASRYMPTLLCAAALEAVVSFLATVYMVKKKSMHSFLTAMAGAVSNVILNLILIPGWGAMGAAIATAAGYGLVFILRLADAPRMIRFRLSLPGLLTGIALLFASCAIVTIRVPGWIFWCLGITALVVLLNAPALLRSVKDIFKSRKE